MIRERSPPLPVVLHPVVLVVLDYCSILLVKLSISRDLWNGVSFYFVNGRVGRQNIPTRYVQAFRARVYCNSLHAKRTYRRLGTFVAGLDPQSFPKPCRSTNMAAEEEWYFEEEGNLQFSGRPISVTFSPASNCFICTLEDGTIEVVDARSSLRLKRTSTTGLYGEVKHVILIWKRFIRLLIPIFLRLLFEQITQELTTQNAYKSSLREF